MAKEKMRKIYLLINSNKGIKPKKELIEKQIEERLNEGQQGNLFIEIEKDKEVYIDEVICFAEEKKYGVINCGKTYILNKCFQGTKYASFGRNIAHEAINKMKDDNGDRYFFLCDNGKKQVIEIGNDKACDKYIYSGSKYFKVENAEMISFSKYETGQKSNYAVIQRVGKLSLDFIEGDITYNNKELSVIFGGNVSPQGKGIENKNTSNESKFPCVTFKGGEVVRPKEIGKELFCYDDFFVGEITKDDKGKKVYSPKKGYEQLAKASMRQYVFEGTALYKKISSYLEKIPENRWEDDEPWNGTYRDEDSVLSVIGKSDKETYFSSLVGYMFQNAPEILKKFLGDVDVGEYFVYREENNVDILIRGKKNIVIIENKIEAGITDAQCKEWSDLIKEDDKGKEGENIKQEINKERKAQEGQGKAPSQLDKYYSLALYYAKKQGLNQNAIKAYILCPEYKMSYYIEEKKKYINGDNYEVKSYKELKGYIDNSQLLSALRKDRKQIIEDLGRAIYPYAINQNTYYMDQVCGRFLEEVNKELER